ncbi:MAG: hypothetical protein RL570_918 [Actinomycetota bacterium]
MSASRVFIARLAGCGVFDPAGDRIARVTSISAGQVITTGLIDLRRFAQSGQELRVIAQLLGRKVRLLDGTGSANIEDLAIEQGKNKEWTVSELFLRRPKTSASPFARGATVFASWERASTSRPCVCPFGFARRAHARSR